ncbi:hypothetical protein E4F34_07610 [Burkholderia pseudomallei]|nr:hypothetical protein [Burkholderia pseudomallei]MPT68468.1 hypothetical protein [Burkholderia pseudomallei]MPT75713.1 hypothetical protein [Burkholderia pseudomallei]MPT96958.1 hypothetical protein [Burkholderia pseudomallei]QEW73537.1 hypothetical protein E4F35_04900 [Burkholderia pseudomallei]
MRSTEVDASARTPIPCFAVDRSWRFSAYPDPMLCDRPKLALQRLPIVRCFAIDQGRRFSTSPGPPRCTTHAAGPRAAR